MKTETTIQANPKIQQSEKSQFRQYASYKPSNVEWLGDVPSHWKVDRLRDIALINSETLSSDTPNDYQLRYIDISNVNYNGVISFDAIETLEFENAPSRAKRITKAKDTIVSSVRPNLQAVCYINFDDTNLICSTGFNVVRTRNEILDSRFLFYCLISDVSKDFFVSRANGVGYPAIGDYDFGSLSIAFPNKTEQTSIAAYLDQATANIDQVIATKQKQLEKLEQYKQSKIHECVTKGLNPDVTLKPSDIDWIGDVPEHWKVVKFSQFIYIKHGYQFRDYDFTDEGIKIVKITQLKADGSLDLSNTSHIDENRLKEFEDTVIKTGDILMALTGGTIGKIIKVEELNEVVLQNYRVGNFFPYDLKLRKDFMFWVLSSELTISQIFFLVRETGQPNIGKQDFSKMYFSLPPLTEQKEIAEYLDNLRINLAKEKSIIEQQIEKLKQYRKCLIHECVTGKRKVVNDLRMDGIKAKKAK